MQRRLPGVELKHTWQLTACLLQIINGSLPTGSTISITTVVKRSHVRTVINVRNQAHVMNLVYSLVYVDVVTLRVAVLAVGIRFRYLAISGELRLINISTCV